MTVERDSKGRFVKGGSKNPKSYTWKKGVMQNKKAYKKGLTKENDQSIFRQSVKVSKTLKKLYAEGKRTPVMGGFKNKGRKHTEETKKLIRQKRLQQETPKKDTSIELKMQEHLCDLCLDFETDRVIDDIYHKYRCDIYVPDKNLVVECDGEYWHNYPHGRRIDKIRTTEMLNKRYKVLRFWGSDIMNNSEIVKEAIQNEIK